MNARKAWITGAGGLIGNQLVVQASKAGTDFEVVALTRDALELTDAESVIRRFRQDQPALILHCAALSRALACEANPALSHEVNVGVTSLLAGLSQDTVLVYFSTDMVFDGAKGGYTEDDTPRPLSAYGRSKWQAEVEVLKHSHHLILRTSLNYGHSPTRDRAFNEEMLLAAKRGQTIRLFSDEFRCPIPAEVTARAAWEMARAATQSGAEDRPSGLFHLAGSERLSRWEVGEALARLYPDLRGKIQRTTRADYSGPPRPADASLVSAKAQRWLSFTLPRFTEWLAEHEKVKSHVE